MLMVGVAENEGWSSKSKQVHIVVSARQKPRIITTPMSQGHGILYGILLTIVMAVDCM